MHCLAEELEERSGTDYGLNICSKYSSRSTNLTLVSPGYPDSYPQHTECRCIVTAQRYSKVYTHSHYDVTVSACLDDCLRISRLQFRRIFHTHHFVNQVR